MIALVVLAIACTSYGPKHGPPSSALGDGAPTADERADVELSCVYSREDKVRYYFVFNFPSEEGALAWLQRAGFKARGPLQKPLPEWMTGPGNPVDSELEAGCGWAPPSDLIDGQFYEAQQVGSTFNMAAYPRDGHVWGRGEMTYQ